MNDSYPDLEVTVRNYVLGRLTEEEAEQFETYYLSNPDIVEMIEAVQNIHTGLLNAIPETAAERADSDAGASKSWLRIAADWFSVPIPAYAAMIVALAAVPFAFKGLYSSAPIDQLNIANFSTVAVRGVIAPLEIELPAGRGQVGVFVKVKTVNHRLYVLKIAPVAANKPQWVSKPFEVSSLRDKLVVLPNTIQHGKVKIKMFGIEQDGTETPVEFCHYSEVCR